MEFAADPPGMEQAFRSSASAFAKQAATKVIMDAYLDGFAKAGGATLVTFDKALCKIAKRAGASQCLLSGRVV